MEKDQAFEDIFKEIKGITQDVQSDLSLDDIMKEIKGKSDAAEETYKQVKQEMELPDPDKVEGTITDDGKVELYETPGSYEEYVSRLEERQTDGAPDLSETQTVDRDAMERFFEEEQPAQPEKKKGLFSFLRQRKEEMVDDYTDDVQEPEPEELESEYESYSQEEEEQPHQAYQKNDYVKLAASTAELLAQIKSRFLIACVATVLLVYLSLAGSFALPLPEIFDASVNGQINMFAQMILYLAVLVACHKELVNGIRSLIALRAEPDGVLAFSSLVALLHGVVQIWSVLQDGAFVFFGGVIAVVMTVTLYIKFTRVRSIYQNLILLKRGGNHITIEKFQDRSLIGKLIGRHKPVDTESVDALMNAVQQQTPQQEEPADCREIFYEGKVEDTYDFEDAAYSIDESHYFSAYAVPAAICYTVAATALYLLVKKDMASIMHVFAAFAVMVAPFTLEMSYTIPFNHLTKRLRESGTVVLGSSSVRRLYGSDGVVVEDASLFDKGSIYLKSMKFFGDVRIDEVFVDMASVLGDMKCAAASVFMGILQNDKSMLRPVQGWECEQGQGVAAVMGDGKDVFIGRKGYMEKNGFEVPAVMDKKGVDISDGSNMLYVGSNKRVLGVFEICYQASAEINDLMDVLDSNGITVFFKSCDVLLDNKFLEEHFHVTGNSFRTIDEKVYMEVEEVMDRVQPGTSGIYLRSGTLENLADTLCECKRMEGLVRRNLLITMGSMITAPIFLFVLLLSKGVAGVDALSLLVFLGLWIIPLMLNSRE